MTRPSPTATVDEVLASLEAADIRYCLRTGSEPVDGRGEGRDIDILIPRADRGHLTQVLEGRGFHRFVARGHWGHRFFLGRLEGRWVKLDVMWLMRYSGAFTLAAPITRRRRLSDGHWVANAEDQRRHRALRNRRGRPRRGLLGSLLKLVPPALGRTSPVVAVLGPDGAGKSSSLEAVSARIPVATRTVYLGMWGGSHGRLLSTDLDGRVGRLGVPEPARFTAALVVRFVRALIGMSEARLFAWLGVIVLLDRHPSEVRAAALDSQRWRRSLKLLLFDTLLAKPDVVVLLSAPGELLHDRSGQHTAAQLETLRCRYERAFAIGATVVDTSDDPDRAADAVLDVLWDELAQRRGWACR